MIKLFNDFYIIIDDYNYTLVKDTGRTRTKKDGESVPDYKPYGYYMSLAQAIEACRQRCIREELKDGCTELVDAVRTIRSITNRFKEVMEKCLPDDDLK